MEIIKRNTSIRKTTRLKDLEPGSVFRFEGEYLIRSHRDFRDEAFWVVNLENGEAQRIGCDVHVLSIPDASLLIPNKY